MRSKNCASLLKEEEMIVNCKDWKHFMNLTT